MSVHAFGVEGVIVRAALAVVFLLAPGAAAPADGGYGAPPPDLPARLDRLVKAYPDFIAGHDGTFVTLRSGVKFPISDGRSGKSFDALLEHPDIDDMFYAVYPAGTAPAAPPKNFDPGRVRYEPLFVAMYGDCHKGETEPHLRAVAWLPRHNGGAVRITTVNGVDKALEAVSRDLDTLPDDLIKYLRPSAGTYNCRDIAGSTARSMHAYGAAIDVNTAHSDYWRWAGGHGDIRWRNRIPWQIVRIFERHGFIWGGNWYHFDTMHFEYRPELLPRAQAPRQTRGPMTGYVLSPRGAAQT